MKNQHDWNDCCFEKAIVCVSVKCPSAESEAINLNFHCEIWMSARARDTIISLYIVWKSKTRSRTQRKRVRICTQQILWHALLTSPNINTHWPSIAFIFFSLLLLCRLFFVNSCIIWQFYLLLLQSFSFEKHLPTSTSSPVQLCAIG